jgi:hypothetical protein
VLSVIRFEVVGMCRRPVVKTGLGRLPGGGAFVCVAPRFADNPVSHREHHDYGKKINK